jgi:hypothetical protein
MARSVLETIEMKKERKVKITHNAREYLFHARGGTLCLGLPAIDAILKLEQRLPHRIRKRYFARVNERYVAHAPALHPVS